MKIVKLVRVGSIGSIDQLKCNYYPEVGYFHENYPNKESRNDRLLRYHPTGARNRDADTRQN